VAVVVAGAVSAAAGVAIWSTASSAQAAAAYHQQRQALTAQLRAAGAQGYTSQDLRPITTQVDVLDASQAPWLIAGRPGYYGHLTGQTADLRSQLTTLERRVLDQTRADASRQMDAARTGIAQDRQASASDSDVQDLQHRLDVGAQAQGGAHTLRDYRGVLQQATAVKDDA